MNKPSKIDPIRVIRDFQKSYFKLKNFLKTFFQEYQNLQKMIRKPSIPIGNFQPNNKPEMNIPSNLEIFFRDINFFSAFQKKL